MNEGYIKINRRIADHWIFQDSERFHWWFDLLLSASYRDHQVLYDGHKVTLRRGQMIMSVSFLCNRWKRSHNTIRRFLTILEKDGMIERTMMERYTSIITICNYDSYQVAENIEKKRVQKSGDLSGGLNKQNVNKINGGGGDLGGDLSGDKQKKGIYINNKLPKGSMSISKIDEASSSSGRQVESVLRYWNETIEENNSPLKQVRSCNEGSKRRKLIEARIREHGEEIVKEAISKAVSSQFLCGCNRRGWMMTFDWFVLPSNFAKVLDGNYDDKETPLSIINNNNNNNIITYHSNNNNNNGSNYVNNNKRQEMERVERELATAQLLKELIATNSH